MAGHELSRQEKLAARVKLFAAARYVVLFLPGDICGQA
jgi:hypothetical protein